MELTPAVRRRLRRKSERGTTVLTVVMAVTLLLSIGVLAVRNAGLADQAVGYSRQSSQTTAVAELGTSAAIAEFGANKAAAYVAQMVSPPGADRERCLANSIYTEAPCARMFRSDLQASMRGYYPDMTLFQARAPTGKPDEPGSFGMASRMMGDVYVEITERAPTGRPVAGSDLGGTNPSMQFAKVTLTTTAQVRPVPATGNADACNQGIAAVTSKKVIRARVVVGPI